MADEIKEFSKDEVSGTLFYGSPTQSSIAPAQQIASPAAPVASPIAPPSLTMPSKARSPAGIPDPTQLVETVSKANKELKEKAEPPEPPSAIGGLVDQITSNWKPIAATAAATYAATKAAPVVGNAIGSAYTRYKNRSVGAPVETTRIDPVFATPDEMRQAEVLTQKPAPTMTPLQNLQKRADDLRAAVQGQAPNAPSVPPQFGPAGAGVGVPPSPPFNPTPSAAPSSPVTTKVTETVNELMTEEDKPAAPEYPKKTTFKSAAEIPPGFEFRPDVGNLDRSMGNILGKEHREYAREMFTGGKKFGQSANLNDDVSRLTTQYFQNLQQQIPETILGRDARKLQNIPSDFGTFAKNTNFGKGVKVGGVAGTLFAISDLANAKNASERGMAGANLLEAVLPPGMTMSGAGEGSSTVPSADAAMLLGSPYAQSDIAKKRRQQEEYTRKVGAGRGIAPPSAYMR